MRYALFLGCLIPTRLPQIEASSKDALSALGVEVVETTKFLCCPSPVWIKPMDVNTWLAVAARNLCVAEEEGLDVLALCPGCSNTLIEANHVLKNDKEAREHINEILKETDREFRGTIKVKHLLRVLHEDVGVSRIEEEVRNPLNIKMAPHYGCHVLRPSEVMRFDDVMTPRSMDDIIKALGGEPVDYEDKDLCCGSALGTADEESSLKIARAKLRSISSSGAEAISLVCPMCFLQFDLGQMMILRKFRERYDLPVFYLSQLINLAMGMGTDEIGVGLHKMSADKVFEKVSGSR